MMSGLCSIRIDMLDGVKGRDSGVLREGVLVGGGPYFWSTGSDTDTRFKRRGRPVWMGAQQDALAAQENAFVPL